MTKHPNGLICKRAPPPTMAPTKSKYAKAKEAAQQGMDMMKKMKNKMKNSLPTRREIRDTAKKVHEKAINGVHAAGTYFANTLWRPRIAAKGVITGKWDGKGILHVNVDGYLWEGLPPQLPPRP